MNVLEKNLKLSCISCLFLGLAALVVGIVVGAQSTFDIDAIVTLLCGAGSMPAGAQSSRLANVPSNASKVRTISLVICIASVACGIIAYMNGNPTPLQLCAIALVACASFAMLVYSHLLVKRLERV